MWDFSISIAPNKVIALNLLCFIYGSIFVFSLYYYISFIAISTIAKGMAIAKVFLLVFFLPPFRARKCKGWKSNNYSESNTEKKALTNVLQNLNKKFSKDVKIDQYCYRKCKNMYLCIPDLKHRVQAMTEQFAKK